MEPRVTLTPVTYTGKYNFTFWVTKINFIYYRLDIKSKKWESVYICQGNADYEPEGRYRHEVSFDGKNIYLLGGGTADKAFDFCKLPCFNIETLNWSFVKTKADESC